MSLNNVGQGGTVKPTFFPLVYVFGRGEGEHLAQVAPTGLVRLAKGARRIKHLQEAATCLACNPQALIRLSPGTPRRADSQQRSPTLPSRPPWLTTATQLDISHQARGLTTALALSLEY